MSGFWVLFKIALSWARHNLHIMLLLKYGLHSSIIFHFMLARSFKEQTCLTRLWCYNSPGCQSRICDCYSGFLRDLHFLLRIQARFVAYLVIWLLRLSHIRSLCHGDCSVDMLCCFYMNILPLSQIWPNQLRYFYIAAQLRKILRYANWML